MCVRTQAVSHDSFLWGSVCFCLLRCLWLGSVEPDLNQRVARKRLLAFTEWGLIKPGILRQVPSLS